ncbi:MAG: NADPH-dependent glutamate synthase [Candidatus Hydrogenedentes bacterium]|nr:NADPH-dependent glutamate synthase [Candidatus Hydrogenedentota bacterium]
MFSILKKVDLADRIKEFEVEAPHVARKAKPGNFVLVRGDERGERIPLTIADSDADKGTITLVMQEIGKGTTKLGALNEGDGLLDVVGPLGKDREIPEGGKTICCVAGGLGVAPMYPQTKACHAAGNRVISIIGARNKSLMFWQDRMEAVSDEVLYSTDDGSFGHHGFATQLLDGLIEKGEKIDEVIAIGPVPHMKAVADCCKKHGVPVVVSLNPIMVDGTGMCGGCRVTVAGETKYACVDGPEFDGAAVDFDELIARQNAYKRIESGELEAYEAAEGGHQCRLEEQIAREELQPMDGKGPRTAAYFEQEAVAFVLNSMRRLGKGLGRFDEVAVGMTYSQAVREAKRCRLCANPRCVTGCPVEVDIPAFIQAIQEEDLPRAARILKDKNSLPAICGRVCPQETQCEKVCSLTPYERPVAIGALERFVADWEAAHEPAAPVRVPSNGRRVAVVGSGPGGLTCAGDLAKMGYEVTIFEAFHAPGGVLVYGIPEFRLPKRIVAREVDYVKGLGVEIRSNMVIGKALTVDDLFAEGYEAIFIAVGAGAPAFLRIPGENLIGVYSASEFLTRVNLMKAYRSDYDTPVLVGDRVAVIGAGNVSMDAARTAVRLGAREVTIVYRRSEKEMPARAAEVVHARQEGVIFKLLTSPTRILGDDTNHVVGLECMQMELGEPDDSGRRRPVPIKGSEFTIDCDMVIPALGNVANPLLTGNTEGLELNKWGNIVAKPEGGATSIPGVFAGGDIVTGSATVIEAMGAGKQAARAIDAYLREKDASAAPAG